MNTQEIMTTHNIVSNVEIAGSSAGIMRYMVEGTNIPYFSDEINDHAYVDHYGSESGFQNAKLVVFKNGQMRQENFKTLDEALLALVSVK